MTSGEYVKIKRFDAATMSVRETLVRVGDVEETPEPVQDPESPVAEEEQVAPSKNRRFRRKAKAKKRAES